jgi:hypothetical protein
MTRDPIDDLMDHPTPLPDDGFTERVMAALPTPRPAFRWLDRWVPLLGAGVVAAALAPDLAELGHGLAATALQAGQGAAQVFASAGVGGLQGPLTLMVALAGVAALVGSRLVTERP